MATTTFKCPNCGGGLQFNPRSQKSKCEFCLSEFSDAEIVELNNRTTKEVIDNSLKEYSCKSCGAHVVTEETTSATFCYYCHNPVLVTERLAGEFRPSKIIPFTYNKEKAMDSFLRWAKSKKFVPKEFYSTSQLEKITGIYLPYWMADLEANIDYSGKGTNLRVWRVGDKEYTEFKEYKIERQGTIDVDNVHEVALGKIDKGLIDSISPYDESKAIDFSMSYLSGFFAEKYDIEKNQVKPQIEERVRGYATSLIQDTIINKKCAHFRFP
jgi:DNA-directed RNA polymerase subunit RPC12/RpoP